MSSWILRCLLGLGLLVPTVAHAVPWLPFGPDGGDARRVVADPVDHTHLYLGTANGWLYESHDTGARWRRLARVDRRDDLVLDSVVVDASNPKHLIVGARVIGSSDGGVYISYDSGRTWVSQAEMRGESVQALRASASDPKLMVAGTLKGVFRSTDGGKRWSRISPVDSNEIHNIASVAIDPTDANVIYVGTWHLPWKTTDGGEHWENIKEGIIDDSDVFSIIIDHESSKVVYASACSGIYKSEDGGTLFHKIQGIPSTARRTRVLMQDPGNANIVFAGTTEGLWRSNDAGKSWNRTTGPEVIVNDVSIDKADSKHVLLATDRGGVLSSDDGGDTFHSSNGGFSARQITAMKRDVNRPGVVLVGVVNDKEWGGVFLSENGGLDWKQRSEGLAGRDVFALGQAPDGTFVAGTAHGIFRWSEDGQTWVKVDAVTKIGAAPAAVVPVAEAKPAHVVVPRAFVVSHGRSSHHGKTVPASRVKSAAHKGKVPASRKKKVVASRHGPAKPKAALKKASGHRVFASKHASRHVVRAAVAPVARVETVAQAPTGVVQTPGGLDAGGPGAAAPATNEKSFDGSVYALTNTGTSMLAATSIGLLASEDNGLTWTQIDVEHSNEWRYLAAAKQNVVAASLHNVSFSADAGRSWATLLLPEQLSQIGAVAVEPSGRIWVGGREGIFLSRDAGFTWTTPKNLFVNTVNSLFYDESTSRMLMTTSGYTSIVFLVHLPDLTVTFADTGWNLRLARPMGDHLIAATLFDGLVVQPRMVATPLAPPVTPRVAAPSFVVPTPVGQAKVPPATQ